MGWVVMLQLLQVSGEGFRVREAIVRVRGAKFRKENFAHALALNDAHDARHLALNSEGGR